MPENLAWRLKIYIFLENRLSGSWKETKLDVNTLTYPGSMIFEIFVGKMGFLGRGLGIRNIEKAKCGAFSLLTIFFLILNIFFVDSMFFYGTILFSYPRNVFFLFGPSFFAVFFLSIFFVCSGSRELNRVSSILVVHWKKEKIYSISIMFLFFV